MLNLQVEETSTCMGDMKMPKGPQGQRRPADVIATRQRLKSVIRIRNDLINKPYSQ